MLIRKWQAACGSCLATKSTRDSTADYLNGIYFLRVLKDDIFISLSYNSRSKIEENILLSSRLVFFTFSMSLLKHGKRRHSTKTCYISI